MDGGKKNDRDRMLKEILSDFEKKEDPGDKCVPRSKIRFKKEYTGKILLLLWALVTIFLAVRLMVEVKGTDSIMWARGIRKSGDYKINECIANMWYLRRASDNFYGVKNMFPEKIDELYGSFVDEGVVCPASGEKYKIMEYDGRKCFACPSPEKHGVSALFCRVVSGAPEIDRDSYEQDVEAK